MYEVPITLQPKYKLFQASYLALVINPLFYIVEDTWEIDKNGISIGWPKRVNR